MVACQATRKRNNRREAAAALSKDSMQRAIDNARVASDHPAMIANRTMVTQLHTISPLAGRVEGVLR